MLKICILALTVSEMLGFIYGLVRFVGKRTALYTWMIVYGVGCAMMGRMFEVAQLFGNGEIGGGFHVGILGVMGSFLFFLTANFGQMDSLVDDGSAEYTKYRLIAFAAPAVVAAIYIYYYTRVGFGENAIVRAVESVVIATASYYHLKHLIIKDVNYGIIGCLRKYNLLALIYALMSMTEMVMNTFPVADYVLIVFYGLMSLLMLIFMPMLEGGVKKWTT